MKKLLVCFSLALTIVLFISCSEPDSPSIDSPNGVFKGSIVLFDSSGYNPLNGSITLLRNNTTDLSGNWKLRNGQNGELTGSINNLKININLDPDKIDDNTFLFGEYKGIAIEGRWVHSGVMGVNNKGTFIAISF